MNSSRADRKSAQQIRPLPTEERRSNGLRMAKRQGVQLQWEYKQLVKIQARTQRFSDRAPPCVSLPLLYRDRDLDSHCGHLGAQIPKDVRNRNDVHILALGVVWADSHAARHVDSHAVSLVVFVLVAADSAIFAARRIPTHVPDRLFVPERDQGSTLSANPGG